jgi:hypothetical protein
MPATHGRLTSRRVFRYGSNRMCKSGVARREEFHRAIPGYRTARPTLMRMALSLGLLCFAMACERDPRGPQLDPETFIDVMVELRRAHERGGSTAEFEARRDSILQEAGVTDSTLVQWVRTRQADVGFLTALWDSVNARLIATRDTLR